MATKQKIDKLISSRVVWAVLSLLLSIVLWAYVTDTEGKEISETFNVAVQYEGVETLRESRGMIVTGMDTNTIRVTLRGARRYITSLKDEDIKAVVNLNVITTAMTTQCTYDLTYPTGIDEQALTVVSSSYDVITVTVETLTSKPVNLKENFTGSMSAGYMAAAAVFEPASVKVTGPASELAQIDHAVVEIARTDIDSTVEFDSMFELVGKDGAVVDCPNTKTEAETVHAVKTVSFTKDVPLDVDIIDGAGAVRGTNVTIDIRPATVKLSGDAKLLGELNKISLGTIDLRSFESTLSTTYPIVINNELKNLAGVTEATVTIEIVGLETRSFRVTNMTCTNVTEGSTANIYNETMDVRLRGTSEALDLLAANNIRAVADLADYADRTGIISVPVEIRVDGATDVGAVGNYTLYVIVEKDNES